MQTFAPLAAGSPARIPCAPFMAEGPLWRVGEQVSGGGFNPDGFGDGIFFRTRMQDQGVTAGNPIGIAEDSVGGNNLTSAGGARPTAVLARGGKIWAEYAGAQNLTCAAFVANLPQNYTLAIAFEPAHIATFDGICDGVAGGRLLVYNASNQINAYAGGFLAPSATYPVQKAAHTLIIHVNGGASYIELDGHRVATGNLGAEELAGFVLGNSYDGGAPFVGKIAEAMIWEGELSEGERGQVKGYFVSEYRVNGGYEIEDIILGGENCRIITPDVMDGRETEGVIYTHGLGENETAITDSVTEKKIFYWLNLIHSGRMIGGSALGGNTYNNATARAANNALAAEMVSRGKTQFVKLGQSAGGPLALKSVVDNLPGATVTGAWLIYAVANLAWAEASVILGDSVRGAFPLFPADAADCDPVLFDGEDFDNKRLHFVHSAGDAVVDEADNPDEMIAITTGHALENAKTSTVGDHGDDSNFTNELAEDLVAFCDRCAA